MAYLKKQLVPLKLKEEGSEPATPESGFGVIYFDNSGNLKAKNDSGTVATAGVTNPCTQLHTSVTEVSTTSSTETDLISYTVPANTLNANKDQIEFEFGGTMDTGMGNVQLKVKFGGTTIADSGSLMMGSAFRWLVSGRIIRDSSSSTQKIMCTLRTTADTGPGIITYTSGSIDLTSTAVLKMTADVDDMMMGTPACVNEYLSVTFKPAA